MTSKKSYEVGIIGWPVGHTRSPAMHEAAAKALGIDLRYTPLALEPAQLSAAFTNFAQLPRDGFNVTVPHKETIAQLIPTLDPSAAEIGAVNTVVKRDQAWVGYNTDVEGLVHALREANVDVSGKTVTVLGAGGAARAATAAAMRLGAQRIYVVARNEQSGKSLVESCGAKSKSQLSLKGMDDNAWASETSLLIQATSATLGNTPNAQQFADELPWDSISDQCRVMDLVYDPLQTAVLKRAQAQGLQTIDGLGMLVHQGALAFELWTGQKPSLEIMRKAAQIRPAE